MIYYANPCGPDTLSAMVSGLLGFIDTPHQGNARPWGVDWCADNGAFSDRWEPEHWWAWLTANAHAAGSCRFATAPDVVADSEATYERAMPWLPKIRDLGYRVAYVAQDGATTESLPWDQFDALFIGGSTDWKLGEQARRLAGAANSRGKWVHCGRVNSRKRLQYCAAPQSLGGMGADSADGTFLTFGPDKNLPILLGWLAELSQQGSFLIA